MHYCRSALVALAEDFSHDRWLEFTIQYFGRFDRMLGAESVEADELVRALDRARRRARPLTR
jgi:hypothetical protein